MKSIAVGIDVSKDTLEVFAQGVALQVKNDPEGIQRLLAILPPEASFNLEASGGYEREVKKALQESGRKVKVHNPRRIRRFADVQGYSAKTDRLDAKVLSQADNLKASSGKDEEQEHLCDLSRYIQKLKERLAADRKTLKKSRLSPVVARHLKRQIAGYEKEIQSLEKEYVEKVKASSRASGYKMLLSVPCIGPVLARILSAELPKDFTGWDKRKIAAYAGLAPMDNASGSRTKTSRLARNANMHIKGGLYMPARAAAQKQPWAKDLYARLMARGKTTRQAIVAVMRQLLIRGFVVMRRGSAWQAEPPMRH